MKRTLISLSIIALLLPNVSLAADSYGWSMYFSVPNQAGSTQYYSKVFATAAECNTNANLTAAQLSLPEGATRDTSKPVVCNCASPLSKQGATCDVKKFNGAQAALAASSDPVGASAPTSLGFVPLTSIPGIESAGNAATLPDFLNNLYKLLIGAAAVLAVIQIVRAGILYMGGDSVTEKKEAKNLIALSIGGLILILSPVVVFSIINPRILDLKINGLDALGTTRFTGDTTSSLDRAETVVFMSSTLGRSAAETKCKAEGGTKLLFQCRATDGTLRELAVSQSCKAGEEQLATCTKTGPSTPLSPADTQKMCETYHRQIAPDGAACSVVAGESWSKIDSACCFDVKVGQQCCGALKSTYKPYNDKTTADVSVNLVLRFFVYKPITGDPSPKGPVPEDKNKYSAYVSACTEKGGKKQEKYAPKSTACTATEIAGMTGISDGMKPYIECMAVTVSCLLP